MANTTLIFAILAVAPLSTGGCDRLPRHNSTEAVTVKLPPPRTASPGFAFSEPDKSDAAVTPASAPPDPQQAKP